jgi:multidrug resistance protein, MATE family
MNNYRNEAKTMLHIGMPIVIGQLGLVAMGVADTIQVGMIPEKGAVCVAASGIANSLFFTIAIVGLIAIGVVAPMISKARSENNLLKINVLYQSTLRVALLLGIATCLLSSILTYFLDVFKQDPEVIALAKPFSYLISFSAVPMFFFLAIRQLSDGFGRTRLAMIVTISALVLNIILNAILINGWWFFPRLGVMGAGVATLLSRTYMMIAMWLSVHKDNEFTPFLKQKATETGNLIRHILKIGLPAGLQGFFEVAVFAGAVIIIGWSGKYQQAAHLIAINLCSVTYMMATGIASAGGIRVGHFWGLHERESMRVAGNTALGLSGGFMFLCAILFIIFNKWFIGLYTDDINVVPIAVELLIIGGFFQISDGWQATALGLLRGVSDVNLPTFITLFSYWIFGLPIGYFLSEYYGLKASGVWIGLTAGLTASALLLNWRFYRLVKRMKVG